MIQTLVDRDSINDETVVIRKIYVSSGQYVAAGSLILEYETTKTTVESNASSAGVVTLEVKESDEVDVGALLYQISSEPPAVGATAADGAVPQAVASRIAAGEALQATRDGLALLSQPRLSRDATAHAEKCGIGVGAFPAGKWVTRADVESLAHGHQTISDQAIERIAVGRFDGRDTENT
ncbi:MAG: biotin/lipoyl-containing protein, partial [Steroidobacteraceae bacterium]